MVKLKKVRSSTILETLVAAVIILVIFSFAITLFLQTTPTKDVMRLKAKQILAQYVDETGKLDEVKTEERVFENFILRRRVVEKAGRRISVVFQIYFEEKLQISQQRIMLVP